MKSEEEIEEFIALHKSDTLTDSDTPTQVIPAYIPKHAVQISMMDRLYGYGKRVGPRLKWLLIGGAILLLLGMVLVQPPSPRTDACTKVSITKPVDVNQDGFIDCRSALERGEDVPRDS